MPPIARLDQLRALASPVRQEIIDAVTASGPISISTLARVLGRTPHALYFHIRKLESLGLLKKKSGPGVRQGPSLWYDARGRPAVLYDVPSHPMALAYRPGDTRTHRPMTDIARAMARSAARSFAEAYRSGNAVVSGQRRNLWASRSKRYITPRELEILNAHLRAIVSLLNKSSVGTAGWSSRKLVELTFILAQPPAKTSSRRRA